MSLHPFVFLFLLLSLLGTKREGSVTELEGGREGGRDGENVDIWRKKLREGGREGG